MAEPTTTKPPAGAMSTFKLVVITVVAALGGTGGAIAFLLGFAGESRAQAVEAAQGIAAVQSLRIDAISADNGATKKRLEEVDAGVARKLEALENKVDEADRRSAARADKQEELVRQILFEVRKK